MRIFVAGATGAIGKQLVPQLVEAGHNVTGATRSPGKAEAIRGMGAEPVVVDALDAEAVGEAVAGARPEVVINQLTAIPDDFGRDIAGHFELTNRLRTEGTDILLSAAKAAGAKRYIAQGFAPWSAQLGGPRVQDETAPLPGDEAPASVLGIIGAIRHLESAVTSVDGMDGLVLRYGGFYGPGTSLAAEPGSQMYEAVRGRKMPIVGPGTGVWSFIHIADAAAATVAALDGGTTGIYSVTDDEPAEVREWLPYLAEVVGAKKPFRVPKLVGRLAAGPAAVAMMNDIRGSSNAKAKRELGWEPRFATWRDGFAKGLS